jgi:N utilization substance protein B
MSRRKARVLAFQALYCFDAAPAPLEQILAFEWEGEKLERTDETVLAFARNLAAGTIENLPAIDEKIKKNLKGWDITRLKRVDLAVLRISVYSLLFQKDIPAGVVIEEAIGICKDYGTEGAFKFVNGALDAIRKTECEP